MRLRLAGWDWVVGMGLLGGMPGSGVMTALVQRPWREEAPW